jgi:hypothetical protein
MWFFNKEERLKRKEECAYKKYTAAVDRKDPNEFKYYLKWLHLNRHFKDYHKRERVRKSQFIKWFKKTYVPYGTYVTTVLIKLVDYQYDFWTRKNGVAAEDEYLDKIIAEVSHAKELADKVRYEEDRLYLSKSVEEGKEIYDKYNAAVIEFFSYVGSHCENWSD